MLSYIGARGVNKAVSVFEKHTMESQRQTQENLRATVHWDSRKDFPVLKLIHIGHLTPIKIMFV
jgi:hypothetical protein